MKRLIALILVVLMLGSTAAFAAAGDTTLEMYNAAGTPQYTTEEKTLDTPKTELWLQVAAEGQIDVTVPLVLVFKTDIDGGTADTATNYKITNNNSNNLVVSKIETATNNNVGDETHPMKLIAYTGTPVKDQYKVQITPLKADDTTAMDEGAFDLFVADNATTHTHDASTDTNASCGLFTLNVADDGSKAAEDTVIKVDMSTGRLSFVTTMSGDGEVDPTMGVKLLTVTYTIAVNTDTTLGEEITTP